MWRKNLKYNPLVRLARDFFGFVGAVVYDSLKIITAFTVSLGLIGLAIWSGVQLSIFLGD